MLIACARTIDNLRNESPTPNKKRMEEATHITISYGDGIGAEIMTSVLSLLMETRAPLNIDTIQIGKECYEKAYPEGITPDGWKSILRNTTYLRSPYIMPNEKGNVGLEEVLNEALGLYAEFIQYTPYPSIKNQTQKRTTLVRELKQGFSSSIEYKQPQLSYNALYQTELDVFEKLVIRSFEYASLYHYPSVKCVGFGHQQMSLLDAVRKKRFKRIASNYDSITAHYEDIDALLYSDNQDSDEDKIFVIPDLYFNIIRPWIKNKYGAALYLLESKMSLGDELSVFSTSHNALSDLEGTNTSDPSQLLLAAIMMLNHTGHFDIASKIHNAWLKTIEDGFRPIYSNDIDIEGTSVSTMEFSQNIIKRLYQTPSEFSPINYSANAAVKADETTPNHTEDLDHSDDSDETQLVGVDVFFGSHQQSDEGFIDKIIDLTQNEHLQLQYVASGRHKVWPQKNAYVNTMPYYARFLPSGAKEASQSHIVSLLKALSDSDIDFVKTEHLYLHDTILGFNIAKGA